MIRSHRRRVAVVAAALLLLPAWIAARQGRGGAQFPGGTNPDGSLRPSRPVAQLFTQDAYTEYQILEPGSEQFSGGITSSRDSSYVSASASASVTADM